VSSRISRAGSALLTRKKRFQKTGVVVVFEGWTPPARAAPFAASPRPSTRATTGCIPSPRPPRRSARSPTSGASGGTCRGAGEIAIFDRSWYGRVLVERVEGFCKEARGMRAYVEINDFEEQLAEHGVFVVKFWLQVDPEEQLRRFKEREETGFKRFKITAEDWRNRERWDDYELAPAT
jgi:hypothetical protein